ncbi:orf108a (mitochondrion) [Beta vulgaris subsp. vulgaris]|uniref:Orf108a protein n=3 Tax=Beta TaxID=3554 RepID=Q9MF95_BETVV|nr:orf108a [Beta vulgaris subsp. vulgaris]YP_004222287.1 hypothetical protein LKY74_mgp116 [Beta vulgaris subsp. maritima]YP_004842201.1 hypothetical protein LKY79_mgp004 [Beta macrocarpa]CBJ14107.1 hypothetical protein [Beta vulgaris subsp. maritima]CBJ17514.1 hypothetical protein [Beta vulgaris subsp. maritima]CBJ23347.1 hypothetical protein [Beta vulgaris subsp. maritima]CBL52036.1 hypothetical protein [Beta vulgaris subsp. maritima]CBX25006.1 hypothetical protein [Beta macrocarpa]
MLSGSYFLFGCSFALIHSMFLIARKDFLRIYKRKSSNRSHCPICLSDLIRLLETSLYSLFPLSRKRVPFPRLLLCFPSFPYFFSLLKIKGEHPSMASLGAASVYLSFI